MNSIVLLGRTTSAIELKSTTSGKSVASFSLAVKRPFTKDTTDFINIVAWDKQAEVLSKHVSKGTMICIRGYLQIRNWTDANGNKRYATEVVASEVSFVESKKASETNVSNTEESFTEGNVGAYTADVFEAIGDEDLPF